MLQIWRFCIGFFLLVVLLLPGGKIHVGKSDGGIFPLQLPERSKEEENWESNVSSAGDGSISAKQAHGTGERRVYTYATKSAP